jgi:hypothetical protein
MRLMIAQPPPTDPTTPRQQSENAQSYQDKADLVGGGWSVTLAITTLIAGTTPKFGARLATIAISRQCIEQGLGLLQVCGVKAFGEPGIQRRKEGTSFVASPLM